MSPRRRRISVTTDGLVASSPNPAGQSLAQGLEGPERLEIADTNGQLLCQRVPDPFSLPDSVFALFPAVLLSQIRRRLERRGAAFRLVVTELTRLNAWTGWDGTHPIIAWINFLFGRGKAGGLIQHWDGMKGFAWRIAALVYFFPQIRIVIASVHNKTLNELNAHLAAMGEAPIRVVTLHDVHPAGVRVLLMNAQAYFARNRYLAGPHEVSITGIEPLADDRQKQLQLQAESSADSDESALLLWSGSHRLGELGAEDAILLFQVGHLAGEFLAGRTSQKSEEGMQKCVHFGNVLLTGTVR